MRFSPSPALDESIRQAILEAPYVIASDIGAIPGSALVIDVDGVDRIPAFQLTSGGTWMPMVLRINDLLCVPEVYTEAEQESSRIKTAMEWWFTPSPKLNGTMPYLLAGESANARLLTQVARENLQLTLPPFTAEELQKAERMRGGNIPAEVLGHILQQPVIPYDLVVQKFELPGAYNDLLIILTHPNGIRYCPAFQFNLNHGRPRELVMVINHTMGTANGDGLAVADWWLSGHSYNKGGDTPASLLDTSEETRLPVLAFFDRYDL